MKKLWSNYKKPTPDKWRKIGDSLLAVSIFLGTTELTMFPHLAKWVPLVTVILGAAGKFLTNFFAPKDDSTSNK